MNAMDALVESKVVPAARLAVAVADRDVNTAQSILAAQDWHGLAALAVALASLIPVNDPAVDVFAAWSRRDAVEVPPISADRAAANRALLESELAASHRSRRASLTSRTENVDG